MSETCLTGVCRLLLVCNCAGQDNIYYLIDLHKTENILTSFSSSDERNIDWSTTFKKFENTEVLSSMMKTVLGQAIEDWSASATWRQTSWETGLSSTTGRKKKFKTKPQTCKFWSIYNSSGNINVRHRPIKHHCLETDSVIFLSKLSQCWHKSSMVAQNFQHQLL